MDETPIIYSTSVCPRCHALKEWCKDNGIVFKSENLEEDLDKLNEFKAAGHRALPIIVKNGVIHAGPKGAQEFITA